MYRKNSAHGSHTPDPFTLCTSGKSGSVAIAYNLACDNAIKFIQSMEPGVVELNPDYLENLSDRTIAHLRAWLWKGNVMNRNKAGYSVVEDDRRLVIELLCKLNQLRNFQSHFWHSNTPIRFNTNLKMNIERLHDEAVAILSASTPKHSVLYEELRKEFPLFDSRGQDHFITRSGRIFFLSFFLNSGEMHGLLQSTRSFKRTNEPEYKFTHEVFTYYCHREGASWQNMGMANEELPEIDMAEQQRILKGRQAYKILNYLSDTPDWLHSEDWPILYKVNEETGIVDSRETLLEFIESAGLFPELELTPVITDHVMEEADPVKRNEAAKHKEQQQREGWIEVKPKDQPWRFELSYSTLRHIVVEMMAGQPVQYRKTIVITGEEGQLIQEIEEGEKTVKEHFYGVLEDCIRTRQYFYEALKKAGNDPLNEAQFRLKKLFNSIYINYSQYSDSINEVNYTADQFRHLPILAGKLAEKRLINWHEAFTRGAKSEPRARRSLLNCIRPETAAFDKTDYQQKLKNGRFPVLPKNTDPEPLVFHLNYYYKELKRKPRQGDMFMKLAAQWLYDSGLLPGCFWEWPVSTYDEKPAGVSGERKLRQEIHFLQSIPDGGKIRLAGNCLTLGYPKHEGAVKSRDFYKIQLNEKAMRYLLISYFQPGAKTDELTIANWLQLVKNDCEKLFKNTSEELQLLDDISIPAFLKASGKTAKAGSLKDKLLAFISQKLDWINEQFLNFGTMSRNDKNQALKEAYLLFDFRETIGGKFLRKNEFQQMSRCHFLMNMDRERALDLIDNEYRLKQRLPEAIYTLIRKAISLDDLLELILTDRENYLKNLKANISGEGFPSRELRKLADQFSIKLPDNLLPAHALTGRQEERTKTKEQIPFVVHPAMVLKYFFLADYAENKFSPNSGNATHRNIFNEYRKKQPKNPLLDTYYQSALPEKLMPETALNSHPDAGFLEKQKKRLTGQVNLGYLDDLILWKIAEDYLNGYDVSLAQNLKNSLMPSSPGKPVDKLDVSQLFEKPVVKNLANKAKQQRPIYLELRMHQVDDYFFRINQQQLYDLASHFVNRREEELELYRDSEMIQKQVAGWPDGSQDQPLQWGDLIQERRIIAGLANELVDALFDFEKYWLNEHCSKKTGKTEIAAISNEEKQRVLQELANMEMEDGRRHFLDFNAICSLIKDIEPEGIIREFKNLRNNALHCLIPGEGSFRKITLPGTEMARLLHIYKPLGKDRRAVNIYLQDGKN